ncbi:hypothetical protein N3K66_008490 [Trichothecium roseum]|uniref:Uncharacterized protein n=1 Tax=Trichothecium roseum TaxID=47278 RepID=A0ACC0UQR0_9HYPO|nr:hypothetical protein N3K66_008490 [Trichothecium roseum]
MADLQDNRFVGSEKLEAGDSDTMIDAPTTNDNLDSDSPITYLYLTWATSLPLLPESTSSAADLPRQPKLKPYSDPQKWSAKRKNILLVLSCMATFLTAYAAGSYSPPSRLMAVSLGASHLATLAGITTFCAGFSLAPMALAPVSEIWGRYPVFLAAGTFYVVFELVCVFMTSLAGMLIARLCVGIGASVFSSVIGGVIADLWDKEDRNTPMALFSGAVLLGTGAGPLVASAIVDALPEDGKKAWQWCYWHQVIFGGILILLFGFFFKETRASVLLTRKAAKLNKWYEQLEAAGVYGVLVRESDLSSAPNPDLSSSAKTNGKPSSSARQLRRVRWRVAADEQRASVGRLISASISRPFYLFFTEPVVFFFSLWAAFAWSVLYLAFAVVPYLHGRDFSSGYKTFVCMIVGSLAATVVGIWQESLLKHSQWRRDVVPDGGYGRSAFWALMRERFPADAPEARLYFACITSFLLPVGLFVAFMPKGTTTQTDRDDGGVALAVGLGLATWGIYAIYLAAFNYLADTYHVYASSALAAKGCARNLLGGAFPLVTASMFDALGLKGGGALLAGVALLLTGIPWVLVFNGESIRARSKTAISLQKLEP